MAKQLTYRETVEYVPIDVAKGLDRLTGKWVQADDPAPVGYALLPRCVNCKNYTPDTDLLGVCYASKEEPKFFAYADMCVVTCDWYKQV